jgi:PAS domain S-box-containing protein
MGLQDSTNQPQISLAYLPPTPRQAWSALAGAAVLLLGLAVLAPFAAKPLPQVNGFIPALDAIIFVTDLITAGLLLAHFSITRSRALGALGCGYLFSALIVVLHGLTFPGAFSPTGNLGGSSHTNFRIYLLWHLGLPVALFAYVWLRDEDRTKAGGRTPTEIVAICGAVGVLVLVSCIAWLALLPPVDPVAGRWLTIITMLICAVALSVLWAFRRSALDQWLMVVVLAMIVELAITALIGGLGPSIVTLGFYTGRLFSLVTSTVVLTALLAETTRLYADVARANMLASVVKASQALSSEIELPKLIERLMTIALENAGADRGLLILPAGDEHLIHAVARAAGNRVEVLMCQEPITRIACPESLVRYVVRTRESVILDDASKPNLFSADDYLHDRQSKSILCLPLIKQRELAGILLLENALTSHAFTPDRVAVLELLAAQAAISLENTRLYGDLQEREAKVRRLVDSNIIGVCIFDLDRRIMEANDAFLGIVGYSRDDVISGRLSFSGLTPPEWAGADQRALAEMASTGTCRPYEKDFLRKDNSHVPVLVGGATFGELRHQGVAFVVDLTERKRAEAELVHANRVATMGQLTASIAHEVIQPIAGVLMNAGTAVRWLARQPPNLEKAKQSIDGITRDGNRAVDIIRRIRDFSKKAPAQKGGVEINEAILEIMGLTRVPMLDNGVSAQMRLAEGLPHIFGDRVQLQQVILNLIMNAIEAMSEVGEGSRELSISTSNAESDSVLVAVSDTGPGLSQASPERIFEAFYTTKSSGLGMGLSICRSIVEAHGGRLWAGSNEPHGAIFYLMLPIEEKSVEISESSMVQSRPDAA